MQRPSSVELPRVSRLASDMITDLAGLRPSDIPKTDQITAPEDVFTGLPAMNALSIIMSPTPIVVDRTLQVDVDDELSFMDEYSEGGLRLRADIKKKRRVYRKAIDQCKARDDQVKVILLLSYEVFNS